MRRLVAALVPGTKACMLYSFLQAPSDTQHTCLNINELLLHPSPPECINAAYKWFPLEAVKASWKEPIYRQELAKSTRCMSVDKDLFLEMSDNQREDISHVEDSFRVCVCDQACFCNWTQYIHIIYLKDISNLKHRSHIVEFWVFPSRIGWIIYINRNKMC